MYISTTTSLPSLSDLGRTHIICYPLTTTSLSWLSDNELIIYFFTSTSLPWLSDNGRITFTLTNTSLLCIECPWTCNLPFTYSRVFILFILYYYYLCWRTAYVFNYYLCLIIYENSILFLRRLRLIVKLNYNLRCLRTCVRACVRGSEGGAGVCARVMCVSCRPMLLDHLLALCKHCFTKIQDTRNFILRPLVYRNISSIELVPDYSTMHAPKLQLNSTVVCACLRAHVCVWGVCACVYVSKSLAAMM